MTWVKKRVLVTVKAYPEPSKKYGESVCMAGITDDNEWIRLYPIPFEVFRGARKISKYSWIEVECQKADEKLQRKESYKVRPNTITVVDESLNRRPTDWDARNKLILPMISKSLEELADSYQNDRTSLGLIKPASLIDFYKQKDIGKDELKLVRFIQMTIEGKQRSVLEQIPYVFKYRFSCDDRRCKSHDILCEDWELIQSWREWIKTYKTEEILWEKIRQKYYREFIEKRDLYFYVGTHSLYPVWLIIGLYYPPKQIS